MFGRRVDGVRVRGLDGNRAIMPFIMKGRNESAVWFEQTVDLEHTLVWLKGEDATLFELLLYAIARTLYDYPRLNRYVSGRRLYQREKALLSFAMKPAFDTKAALSVLKMSVDEDDTFATFRQRVRDKVGRGRKGERSQSDKEADLFTRLPAPILGLGIWLFRTLDALNLAPASLIGPDPMHASVFAANLGSVGLDAAWHHLYEYGTCPIFVTMGRIQKVPVVVGDDVIARTGAKLRYTYDERIEDGLYAAKALDTLRERLERPDEKIVGEGASA